MYSIMIIGNTTVLYTWKFLRVKILNILTSEKNLTTDSFENRKRIEGNVNRKTIIILRFIFLIVEENKMCYREKWRKNIFVFSSLWNKNH